MDATDVKVELLRLLAEDPEVWAAIIAVVAQDVRVGRVGHTVTERAATERKQERRLVPPWLQR